MLMDMVLEVCARGKGREGLNAQWRPLTPSFPYSVWSATWQPGLRQGRRARSFQKQQVPLQLQLLLRVVLQQGAPPLLLAKSC